MTEMPHITVLKPAIMAADQIVVAHRQWQNNPSDHNLRVLNGAVKFYAQQRECKFMAPPGDHPLGRPPAPQLILEECWEHRVETAMEPRCFYCHSKQGAPHKPGCPTQPENGQEQSK